MKRIFFLCLMLVVFSSGKTIPLAYNTPVFVHADPGDTIRIEDYPSQWGYSRVVLGLQASGVSVLEGSFGRGTCQYPMTGF